MSALVWEERRDLARPVMVAAFEGWNDAAEAASGAVRWLEHRWDASRIARVDPDEYFDFQSVRPQVELVDGVIRELQWPDNECYAAHASGAERDVVLLEGTEPNFRWRRFCDELLTVFEDTGCEMMVTLGALLADVPHTRPVRVTGTAGDDRLAAELGLERSRYEGPTGIVGVLHDTCRRRGIPSVSLWAPVPHYVANPPNPLATLALLDSVGQVLGAPPETSELATATEVWRKRVDEAVAEDDETETYVRQLEERYDEEVQEVDLPTGDDLARQIQRYLADESGDPGDPGDDLGDD